MPVKPNDRRKVESMMAKAISTSAQVQQIASRIRELREVLEMSAEDVAQQLGVCVEDYLRYEKGEDDIPVGVLYGFAALCEVDPTLLLTGLPPKMRSYTLVKGGSGVMVERYTGYQFTSLAANYVDREMEPMIVHLAPIEGKPEFFCHSGQEFNYVLEGTVKVLLGEHELILEKGDSLYFDPRIAHAQLAVGGDAKFLTVINEQATSYGNATRPGRRQNKAEYQFKG